MEIIEEEYICPKCNKVYINKELLSYSRGFEDMAEDFLSNNKNITICPDCNVKLVKDSKDLNEDEIRYQKETIIIDNNDIYNVYKDSLSIIHSFLDDNLKGKIELIPKIENVHDERYDMDEKDYYYVVGYLEIVGYDDFNQKQLIAKAKLNSTYWDNSKEKKIFIKKDLAHILLFRSNLIYKNLDKLYKKYVRLKKTISK